ncbi:MAG TPA: adenylate cyclase, partial [Ruegeria sp.]|nr:adenylate cyclase [Ruegeria sp.]
MVEDPDSFYASLRPVMDFPELSEPSRFTPLPDDWVLGTADIVDSTGEIARGRYKTVNMVGAAVISAMINAMGDQRFPYVFGGDGAGFAVPGDKAERVRTVLADLR